jgi:hypothetical protein
MASIASDAVLWPNILIRIENKTCKLSLDHQQNTLLEVDCSIGSPEIISISGPYKGSAHDATIAEISGIKEKLGGDECLLMLIRVIEMTILISLLLFKTPLYTATKRKCL